MLTRHRLNSNYYCVCLYAGFNEVVSTRARWEWARRKMWMMSGVSVVLTLADGMQLGTLYICVCCEDVLKLSLIFLAVMREILEYQSQQL